jgi:hypothetical protein
MDDVAVARLAVLSWALPTPLLLFAGVVALWPLPAVVRWPTSGLPLFVEALGITLAVIALIQLAWLAFWLLEQRW